MATGALRSAIRIASFHRFVWNTRGLTGQSPLPGRVRAGITQKTNTLDYSALNAPLMVMPCDPDFQLRLVPISGFVPFFCLVTTKIFVSSAAFPLRIWCGLIFPQTGVDVVGWTGSAAAPIVVLCLMMPTQLGHKSREFFLRALGGMLASSIYHVKTFGRENLPDGGFLLLPNHMSYVDAVVLQLACPRPIRFVVHESIYRIRWLNPILRMVDAIPISSVHAKDAVRKAVERIREGEIVCIFPEGELSRTGVLIKLRKGFEMVARLAEAPVVPVWLDGLWDSIFSFERGRYFFKWPKRVPQLVTIAFGQPIEPHAVRLSLAREKRL